MPQAIRVVDRLVDQADVAISSPANGHLLTYNSTTGKWGNAAPAAAGVTVQEADGTPSVAGVTTLIVSNGTLTNNGGGSVTVTTGGGGGGSVPPAVQAAALLRAYSTFL